MPLIKTSIEATSDFPRITREINELAKQAVAAGAQAGAQVASAIAAQRSDTGAMAGMRVSSADGTPDGWRASFVSPVFYAWFQNYGTLGNRRKRLKQAPRTDRTRAPGTGIKPLRFLDAGRAAGRRAMLEHISRGLPR